VEPFSGPILPKIASDPKLIVHAKHYLSVCCKYRKVRYLNAGQLELQSLPGSGEGEVSNKKKCDPVPKTRADTDTNPRIKLRLSGICQAKKALAEFLYSASA
jgi:hypothetical protein